MRKTRGVAVAAAIILAANALLLGLSSPTATAASGTFSNPALMTIPTAGAASPHPSSILVQGLGGIVTDVNVSLENVGHTNPDDLDILLVSPAGDSVVLMSDACNGADFEDLDWTFDDQAPGAMPDNPVGTCSSPTYRPSAYDGSSDTWPGAFPGPHGTELSHFNGKYTSGYWQLYVYDDAADAAGDIELGWVLEITTRPAADVTFTTTALTVVEGAPAHLTISRTASGPTGPASVRLGNSYGYGAGPEDFAVSQVVNFAPGENSKDVPLTIVDDSTPESSEKITVTLSANSGDVASAWPPPSVTVTIAPSDLKPNTTFTKVPRRSTSSPRAKLKFIASTPGSTFKCKVDRKAWKSCSSPLMLKNLKRGTHVVLVRATDPSGLVESSPAVARWSVR